jgi:hypothetical protein
MTSDDVNVPRTDAPNPRQESHDVPHKIVKGLTEAIAHARIANLEAALRNFTEHFSVNVPETGLAKGRLVGWYGSPGAQYAFLCAGNSYDEMVLGHLQSALEAANDLLNSRQDGTDVPVRSVAAAQQDNNGNDDTDDR